jgi:hypothetical protein
MLLPLRRDSVQRGRQAWKRSHGAGSWFKWHSTEPHHISSLAFRATAERAISQARLLRAAYGKLYRKGCAFYL